jgi:transposase
MPKDTSRHYHSSEVKNQIIGAMLADESLGKHSHTFDIPYDTAQKIWRKYRETGSVENQLRSSRPPKIMPRMERQIRRKVLADHRKPFTKRD